MACSDVPKESSKSDSESGFEIVGGCMPMPAANDVEADLVGGGNAYRREGVADHVGKVIERDHAKR